MDSTVQSSSSGSGLDENVAGALAYFFGILGGAVFYFVDKERDFVRFHAVQSMVLTVAAIGVFVVFSILATLLGFILQSFIISILTTLVWLALALGFFALWAYMMYTTYQGKTVKLPVVGNLAESIAN